MSIHKMFEKKITKLCQGQSQFCDNNIEAEYIKNNIDLLLALKVKCPEDPYRSVVESGSNVMIYFPYVVPS